MEHEHDPDELTEEDLDETHAERLPDREAMTVLKPPLPVDLPVDPLPPVYTIDPPPPDEA
jgi:hypothetical protein